MKAWPAPGRAPLWLTRRFGLAGVLSVSALCQFSCQVVSHQDAAQELACVTQAIDAVRDAPSARKAPLLERLRQVPCSRFCALKEQCVVAYQLHVDAVAQTAQVREVLLSGPDLGVKAALERAERDLVRARALTAVCAGAEGDMRRTLDGRR